MLRHIIHGLGGYQFAFGPSFWGKDAHVHNMYTHSALCIFQTQCDVGENL